MADPLRILLVSHNPLRRELGAPKVLIEFGEELSPLGWRVDFLQPSDFGLEHTSSFENQSLFAVRLGAFLAEHSGEYDVVDFDHEYLPFPRHRFSPRTLMVARSVLLIHHFDVIPIPGLPGAVQVMKNLFGVRRRSALMRRRLERASRTFAGADLINVSNRHDREELIRRGLDPTRIVVIPFGISATRRPLFERIDLNIPPQPKVAFVGTFDPRKGAREFPTLLRSITSKVNTAQFKLLGTKGQFPDEAAVRARLPDELQDRIEVVPQFDADRLPNMLADCSVGVFPSHIEGFGFGVLEMLASGLPVIAYDAPGPPEMLPPEWLVPRGDALAMAEMVAVLLRDPSLLQSARARARELSRPFTWSDIAVRTDRTYREALANRRRTTG